MLKSLVIVKKDVNYDGIIKFVPGLSNEINKSIVDPNTYIINYPEYNEDNYEYLFEFVMDNLKEVIIDRIAKTIPRKDVIHILIDVEDTNNMSLFYNYIGDFLNKLDNNHISIDVYMPLAKKYGDVLKKNLDSRPISSYTNNVTEYRMLNREIKPIKCRESRTTRKPKTKVPTEDSKQKDKEYTLEKVRELLKKDNLPNNVRQYLLEKEMELMFDDLDLDSDLFAKPTANENLLYSLKYQNQKSYNTIDSKYEQMIKEMNNAALKSKNLGEYVKMLIDNRHMKQAQLAFKTGIDPSLISKIIGKNNIDSYNAKKDTLALIAFGLELSVMEAKRLFELGGFILRPRETWDKVVLFVLENAEAGEFEYDINIVNTYLQRLGIEIITTRNYKER